MSLKLKAGVKLAKLQPQMLVVLLVALGIFTRYGVDCIVTSANDSRHTKNSLHYQGFALDFRTKHFIGDKKALTAELSAALGKDFDVILEDLGKPNEHIHVEYDPQ